MNLLKRKTLDVMISRSIFFKNSNQLISFFLFICISSSCSNGKGVKDEMNVNTIKFFPQDRSAVYIEDIADTSFFRILSTDQDFLLSYIQKIYFSDSLMIIPQDDGSGGVYIYDLDGNSVRKIDPIGHGAGKILWVTDVWYNEDSRLIDVLDHRLSKILTYDLTGRLVKEEKIKNAESGGLELQFARTGNMLAFERLTAGVDNNRLGVYGLDLKYQKSMLPIPEKIRDVTFGRSRILESYRDSMYYLPFLETQIYAVSPQGVSTAYEFDIPKNHRAPEDYLNGPSRSFDEYFAEVGSSDFIHSFDMLYMTDKYISFNYNKGGSVSRNKVFFSKATKNVLQFSSLKSRALPGMQLLSVVRGIMDDYFVVSIDGSQNRYLPESVRNRLSDNSNPVLMFFKLKDF